MDEQERADALAHFQELDTDTFRFEVARERMQPGRSFSEPAMDALTELVTLYIGARIMARWQRTGEPPSAVVVTVDVH